MKELRASDAFEAVGVTWYFGKLEGRDVLYGMYREGGSTAPLLNSGRHLRTDSETVIDVGLAKSLGIKLGDKVDLVGKPYHVVGLSRETGSFGKEMVFVSEQAMFNLYGGLELYNSIAITQVGKPSTEDMFLLKKWESQVDFLTKREYIDGNVEYWERNVSGLIYNIILVVTLLGALGLAVIVAKQLDLRLPSLGMLRAIGASHAQLAGSESVALACLTLTGLLVAIPVGWLLIQVINLGTPGFHASLTIDSVMLAAAAVTLICIVCILRLVRKIRKVTPMELMRGA